MGNKVIYDWVSFTSKIHDPMGIAEILGLHNCPWITTKGARGYKDRLYYDHISIHYNGGENMGVWCEMSGQGCRVFETHGNGDYEGLWEVIQYNEPEVHLTRLDIAYDDHIGILDISELCNDTLSNDYVSRFEAWEVIQGSKGQSIVHGSRKSDLLIRIYDKAKERGFTDNRHWIRVELQARDARANALVKNDGKIGDKFAGVLINYLRYVEPDQSDKNKWRWSLKKYWSDLVKDAERIRLYEKPGTEYNLFKLQDFVIRQAGQASKTYMDIIGEDNFIEELKKNKTTLNPKYEELRRKHGNL